MKNSLILLFFMGATTLGSCQTNPKTMEKQEFTVQKSEAEWKEQLSTEEYAILRKKATERPFSGEYNMHFEEGTYHCKGCNAPLFTSDSKFDSHCGWPSFDAGIESGAILEVRDTSHGMIRTETVCAKCGGHLGHVFEDGPTETGLRYCINSASIDFTPKKDEK